MQGKVNVFGKPRIIRWGRPTIVMGDGVTLDSDSMHNKINYRSKNGYVRCAYMLSRIRDNR